MYTPTFNELMDIGFNPCPKEFLDKYTDFGDVISPSILFNEIYEYYRYYAIAFETAESFVFEFRRMWFFNYDKYSQAFKSQNAVMDNLQGNLLAEKIIQRENTYKKNYTITNTYGKKNETDTKDSPDNTVYNDYSDTPNSEMYYDDNIDNPKYLTNRNVTHTKGSNINNSVSQDSGEDVTNYKDNNGSDSYVEKIYDTKTFADINKYKMFLYEFIKIFEPLFSSYIAIKNIKY